ncbi:MULTISPECIES: cytochrome c1 [unclassified Halomonas]|uniref:cytochrome c1 n=1 Tax=unclassified Halomonas TaxID=2609666 RepID=UPI0006D965F3|nr:MULTISPECIES: cytochrome c1 [unclassified Halomonas]KPQ22161.1 MAG: ubiquinol-cytochrome c reductase cytochrome c1 subunit PetC [Halomonas sp. HL-93]SBR49630.1 ubiquinol-cytochrome c reductase cytochrome c1 subunit [Halomonas sp. HL-93]SNY96460.1 ubiquinol-cytochrome c reductase cytochrome c1 subunit [Halomonas sp. hl-4]
MKKTLIALLAALAPISVMAAGGGSAPHSMEPDLQDKASLQNGMKLYVNYCMGCHSLEYQRFSRAAEDLAIPQDIIEDNVIFSPEMAFNDQMNTAMSEDDGEAWFGAPPPDLTLSARLHGTDWLYSYLLSFYQDPERPTGVNNTVFELVAMPNVLEPLQGVQEKVCPEESASEGNEEEASEEEADCNTLEVTEQGELTPEEFEGEVYDLTNFLAYVGEPSKLQAQALAPKVLIFLFIFAVIAYFLKREYWRDIH